MLEHCSNYHALAVQKTNEVDIPFVRLRCGMWTCEYCAEKNRSIWRARLINHIVQNLEMKKWAWFTLTAHSQKRGAVKSIKNLRDAWDKLIKRMKRRYDNFDYVRVYEQHKDGSYHLHAIVSIEFNDIKFRKQKNTDGTYKQVSYSVWLAKTAQELKIGYYTHADNFERMMSEIEIQGYLAQDDTKWVQAKKAGYITSYITKYITKISPEMKEDMGRIRHIQTSQKWIRPEKTQEKQWEFKFGIYKKDVLEADENGQRYAQMNPKHYVTEDDFIDTYIFPPDFSNKPIKS